MEGGMYKSYYVGNREDLRVEWKGDTERRMMGRGRGRAGEGREGGREGKVSGKK
jgi:hypothetical protein